MKKEEDYNGTTTIQNKVVIMEMLWDIIVSLDFLINFS